MMIRLWTIAAMLAFLSACMGPMGQTGEQVGAVDTYDTYEDRPAGFGGDFGAEEGWLLEDDEGVFEDEPLMMDDGF